MSRQTYSLPFGDGRLTFSMPEGWPTDIAVSRGTLPPLDEPRLTYNYDDVIGQAGRAVIVFTDATRHCPDQKLAEDVIRVLKQHNLSDDWISFLCAVGMHRPSTPEEKIAKLGPEIVERFTVRDHDPDNVVTAGEIDGLPVQVNPLLVEPGTLVVALGVVEPHQYAGFSGGAKTVVIGCGGPETIAATHGPHFLDRTGTRLGNIDGNPFQEFVRRAGALIGLGWVSNVVLNSAYEIVDSYDGPPDVVHDALVARARSLYEVPVAGLYDVVIAGVGAPKDANLYQASRAATYIGLSGRPVIRPGGVIIAPAPLPEGAGHGGGEQNFIAALERYADPALMMDRMRRDGCLPGEQRAYMVGQLVAQYFVIVVGGGNGEMVRAAHFTPATSMEAALKLAVRRVGSAPKTLIIPHALQTLPVPV